MTVSCVCSTGFLPFSSKLQSSLHSSPWIPTIPLLFRSFTETSESSHPMIRSDMIHTVRLRNHTFSVFQLVANSTQYSSTCVSSKQSSVMITLLIGVNCLLQGGTPIFSVKITPSTMVWLSLFDRSELHSVIEVNKMHHHALVLALHAWLCHNSNIQFLSSFQHQIRVKTTHAEKHKTRVYAKRICVRDELKSIRCI